MSELAESLKERGYSDLRIISSKRIAVLTDENRRDLLQKIAKEFGGTYNPSNKLSSVGQVDLAQGNIILTKSKTSGGSGAGAAITKLGESAQCVYAAAKFYNKGDYSSKSLLESARKHTETDEQDTKIANDLTGDWQESSVAIAERLFLEFSGKNYTFYRGKDFMTKVENKFASLNRIEREFTNINKWSPADIYMATQTGKNVKLDSAKSILELNTILLNNLKSKDIIGVSLKKSETGKPKLKYINVDNTRPKFKYTGLITNKGPNFFSAKDVYLKFDGGEIQFRTFAPTWQGEIKGKYANQGKVSGGPLANIIKRTANKILTPQRNIAKGNIDVDKFYTYYSEIITGQKLNKQKFLSELAIKPRDWQISKFLGSELLYHVKKSTNKDSIISAILGYASSQSQLSAPYVKLSDE